MADWRDNDAGLGEYFYAASYRAFVTLVTVLHDWTSNRGNYLPYPTNITNRLDTGGYMVGILLKPIQHR